jgi:hypothetical protein
LNPNEIKTYNLSDRKFKKSVMRGSLGSLRIMQTQHGDFHEENKNIKICETNYESKEYHK